MAKASSATGRLTTLVAAVALGSICVVSTFFFVFQVESRDSPAHDSIEVFLEGHPEIHARTGAPAELVEYEIEEFRSSESVGAYTKVLALVKGPKGTTRARVGLKRGPVLEDIWGIYDANLVDGAEGALVDGAALAMDAVDVAGLVDVIRARRRRDREVEARAKLTAAWELLAAGDDEQAMSGYRGVSWQYRDTAAGQLAKAFIDGGGTGDPAGLPPLPTVPGESDGAGDPTAAGGGETGGDPVGGAPEATIDPATVAALGEMTAELIRAATRLTVYSIEPSLGPGEAFQGYPIRQKAVLEGAAAASVRQRLLDPATWGGAQAKCFIPRHGVRVAHADAQVDLVICFECNHLRVQPAGAERGVRTVAFGEADPLRKALEAVLDASQ